MKTVGTGGLTGAESPVANMNAVGWGVNGGHSPQ